MIRRKGRSGFTLVEVAVSSGVLSFCGILVVSIMIQVGGFVGEEQVQNGMAREVALFLDHLDRDIMAASEILLDFPRLSTADQRLILKVPEFDSEGLRIGGQSNYVVYEYFGETERMVRTLYDDDFGEIELARLEIPTGNYFLNVSADGTPLDQLIEDPLANTVQVSGTCTESICGREYQGEFNVATTLRNPAN